MLKITDDLDALIDVLPPHLAESVRQRPNNFELLEVVLDLGRLPEARYPSEEALLSEQEVSDLCRDGPGIEAWLLLEPGEGV